MKISEDKKIVLLDKLAILKGSRCQVCGTSEWIVNDTIFEMREFQGGNLVVGGGTTILPIVPVTCKKCGNTVFFNALSLGLIGTKDEPTK